jgi:hypothetical protein
MKTFSRQKSGNTPSRDISLDFGAATTKVARVLEPDDHQLRVECARVIQSGQNVLIGLDLVIAESGDRVDTRPLWVDGPNAGIGPFAAENQNLIAQLLALADQPTSGNVNDIIPKLAGLEFEAYLILKRDSNGRAYNAIATIQNDGAL